MQFSVQRRLTNPFGIINIIKISCFLLQAAARRPLANTRLCPATPPYLRINPYVFQRPLTTQT